MSKLLMLLFNNPMELIAVIFNTENELNKGSVLLSLKRSFSLNFITLFQREKAESGNCPSKASPNFKSNEHLAVSLKFSFFRITASESDALLSA